MLMKNFPPSSDKGDTLKIYLGNDDSTLYFIFNVRVPAADARERRQQW